MRTLVSLFTCSLAASVFAAEPSARLVAVVSEVPVGASELVVIADFVLAPPEGYQEGGGGRNRRRAPVPKVFRTSVPTQGSTSMRVELPVEPADNFRLRVAAIAGTGRVRTVVAGAQLKDVKVPADTATDVLLPLAAPTLALSPENPTSVAAGSTFTVAGIVTDPAGSLAGKYRMRAWASPGAPAKENFSGLQTSTVDATEEGDRVSFSIELEAPAEPTTLYLQFGELSTLLSAADGTYAVFLGLPAVGGDVRQPSIRVEPAATAPKTAGH